MKFTIIETDLALNRRVEEGGKSNEKDPEPHFKNKIGNIEEDETIRRLYGENNRHEWSAEKLTDE